MSDSPRKKKAYDVLPHSAFQGQTPDEMYFETGADVPDQLAAARMEARRKRIETNRRLSCESCLEQIAMAANE